MEVIERALRLFDRGDRRGRQAPDQAGVFHGGGARGADRGVCGPPAAGAADRFEGLVVNYCRARRPGVLLRGLRAHGDFEPEFQMALANRDMAPDIETVFLIPRRSGRSSRARWSGRSPRTAVTSSVCAGAGGRGDAPPREEPGMSDEGRRQARAAGAPGLAGRRAQAAGAGRAGGRLAGGQVAVDLYTEGFKAGLQERDPADGAIVLRGRTVLRRRSSSAACGRCFDSCGSGPTRCGRGCIDGEFEVRIAAQAAEASAPVQGAARSVTLDVDGGGLLGWWMLGVSRVATFLVWGITLLLGAWSLRRGLVSGRTMLAARLAVGWGCWRTRSS
jgi:hypothetical protein